MRRLPVILLSLAALLIGSLASARSSRGPSREDNDKADYLYLEALRQRSQGKHDAAYELLERAYSLNPADNEIAFELARYLFILSPDESKQRSVSLMKEYYDANPADIQASGTYGMMLNSLGLSDQALEVWKRTHIFHPDNFNVTATLANSLAQTGSKEDADRAVGLLDSLEVTEGPSVQLSSNKIQIFYNFKDTASILAEVDRLRRLYPANVDFNVFAGDVYTMFGDKDKALGFYDEACRLDPSSGYAYYSKAEYYKAIGDSAGYDREVFMALGRDNLDVNTKLVILRSYISEMYADSLQQPRIIQLFDTLELQHPLEHDIHSLYVAYLLNIGDYVKATEQQEQTLGLNPADPQGWDMLSSLYMQNSQFEKAEDALNRGLHYYPDNYMYHYKLGAIYDMDGRVSEAPEQYALALENADSTDLEAISDIYASMADNLQKRQLPDSAYGCYEKAILYNPSNAGALNNYAYYLACNNGDLDKALSLTEKAVEQTPESATNLDTYAWVLFKRKDYAKAREIIDKALACLAPREEASEIYEHAGDIYFMDGDTAGAVDFWKKALTLDPDNELLQRKVKNKTFYYE